MRSFRTHFDGSICFRLSLFFDHQPSCHQPVESASCRRSEAAAVFGSSSSSNKTNGSSSNGEAECDTSKRSSDINLEGNMSPRQLKRTKNLRNAFDLESAKKRHFVVGRPNWPGVDHDGKDDDDDNFDVGENVNTNQCSCSVDSAG